MDRASWRAILWIRKQTRRARWYILIEEGRVTIYGCVDDVIEERVGDLEDRKLHLLKDKGLGLYSLEQSDALDGEE